VSHFNALAVMSRKFMDFVSPVTVGTAGNVVYTPAQLLGGIIIRDCAGAARSDQMPTAADIIAALTVSGRPPVVGNAQEVYIRNTSGGAFAVTLVAQTGLILAGTMAVPQNQQGRFLVVVGAGGVVTIMGMGVTAF
jgi:hypothetical protein